MTCSLAKTDTAAGTVLSGLEWDQAQSSEVDQFPQRVLW